MTEVVLFFSKTNPDTAATAGHNPLKTIFHISLLCRWLFLEKRAPSITSACVISCRVSGSRRTVSTLQASSIKFSITFFDCEFNSCKAPSVKLQTLLSSISIDILISNFSQLLYYAKDITSKYSFMSKQYSICSGNLYLFQMPPVQSRSQEVPRKNQCEVLCRAQT